jgi:hypothetical protein
MKPLTAKILDRLFLLLATLCLAARQYDVPSKAFWTTTLKDRGYLVLVLIGIISVFGAFTPFQAYSARQRVEPRIALRQQILIHFGRLLAIGGKADPKVEVGDLGLHIWRVKRTLRHPVAKRLARVTTYRLGTTPVNRPFTPAKGVGVVGLCWKHNKEAAVDVEALASLLTTEADFDSHRTRNGADSVMGMTWVQFNDVKHRGAVFASPVRNGRGTFVGCVSVDASHSFRYLNDSELWQQVNNLCELLGRDNFRSV